MNGPDGQHGYRIRDEIRPARNAHPTTENEEISSRPRWSWLGVTLVSVLVNYGIVLHMQHPEIFYGTDFRENAPKIILQAGSILLPLLISLI